MWLLIGLGCLTFALLIHEFAHAWMAYQLGDPTAKYGNRLSLNPVVHFEPVGFFILAATYISSGGALIMGWAKPVPVDPGNFKNRSLDMALVAAAGPFINFLVAFLCSMIYLVGAFRSVPPAEMFLVKMIGANVGFALFNLIPWPPLDGWKMVGAVLPHSVTEQMRTLELKMGIWSLVVLLVILYLGGGDILRTVNGTVMGFLTGGAR